MHAESKLRVTTAEPIRVAAGYRLGRTGELRFLGQLKRGKNMFARLTAAVFGILLALCGSAPAQNYPSKPLTMIIPFAAGGPTDVLGRVIAQRMSEIMGQQVVVENVGGAGGMTGSKRVADAAPDGYTFVLGTVGTHAQGQSLYKKPLYNAATDFTAVALIAEVPIVLITRKDLPSAISKFITYAKANQPTCSTARQAGSATHLGCVLLNYLIGVVFSRTLSRHGSCHAGSPGRPYRYLCEIITTAKQVDGGTVKGIAMMTRRLEGVAGCPDGLEQGVPKPKRHLERHFPAEGVRR
jgi:tripartite-type tricarboxylate transporter receptor subunit TctC